ncbi:MAG: LamG domain-containing protein [Candidatus Magasanikbacteria bacterium]
MKPKQKLAYILTVFCLLLVPLVALAGSRPSIGNITNTSVGAERVFVGDNGNLNAQTATGDTIGGFPVVITGQTFISSPVLADINSDGLKEISAVTQSPVDVGSGNRIYSLRFFSGSGVELASIELGSAPAYEPVVLVSSGQSKENILLSNSTGLVSLYTFQSSSTISATPFFDNGVLSWVTPNKFGNQIFVGSPTTSSINIYSKSGANWNLSKIFLTPNPVIFPALDDKAGRLYFVDSANDLWAINSVTGVGIAGFPVSLGGQAVDAPIFSDVDAVNADQEIVVALSSGQRAVITTAGVVLQKNLKQKSFLNFNNDANRTNGFYSLLNNNVGYTYDDATGEHRLASQYSNIRLNAPVMDAEVVLPGAMNGLSVTSTAGSLVLAWDQYSGNTIDHINIYRSTSSAVDIDASVLFTTVASTAVTYTDDSVSSSVPYYYSLVAVSFEGALGPVGEWVGPASAGPVIPTSVSFNLDESSGAQSFVGNVEGINILCLAGKCPTAGLPGISGNAIEFNGTNSYGYITDSDLLKPADQLTLEAWIKPEVNPGQSYHTVIAKYTYFLLTVSPAGDLRADITNASGTRVYFSAPNTITFSQWNHVVMTYDGAMIRLYANGVKVGEKAQTGNVSTVSSDVSIGSTNGSADMFKGLIDEAKIYKRVLSDIEIQDSFASMNFTPVIATHLSFSYSEPVGATQFFDQSLKYAMRCPAGKCPTAGLPGISGNAIGFNGTSTFGYIVDNNFTKPQDQFTVEAWIKPEYNPGQTYYTILNKNNFYDLTIRTDGSLQVGVINTSSTQVYMVLPNVITFSQWNHIAMTYDGAIIQVYVNGVKVGEKTQTGWIKQNTTNVYIGSPNGSVGFYKGMIDEVKFHDSVLSAAEVAESFGSVGFTPVVVNELSFSFSEDFGSSRFLDTSKKYSINCSANKCPTAGATGISGNAIQLNGTSSYGYIMDSDLTKPNDQLTLEAWVKPELNPGQSYHTVIAKFTYFLLTISNNGDLRADITNSSGTRVYFSVPNAVAFAQWNHLAMTYDGAMIRLYVNGVKVGEKIQTGNVSTVTSNINIGSTNGSADMFKGLIDEAKIYKRVLTDSEIQASFASLNFTPNMPSNLSFSFSEPAGSNTFLDSSGVYSVRCSANKCPTAGAIGISGNAIQLNGTSSYGYTLDSNLVRAQDQLTVEA